MEKGDLSLRYRQLILEELTHRLNQPPWVEGKVGSLYFGGGTPSLMPPDWGAHVIGLLTSQLSPPEPDWCSPEGSEGRDRSGYPVEVTLEANPETADLPCWRDFRQAGFNRISIGAQSFHPYELEFLGRVHSVEAIDRAVEIAHQAGFENISLDIIYGLPSQTPEGLCQSLKRALGLGITHLSAYSLTIEPDTPFARRLNQGKLTPPDPDHIADLYDLLCQVMGEAGFQHYELTNFARPGYASRHNSAYWLHIPYLGIGTGAHSFTGALRFWNRRSTTEHIKAIELWLQGGPDPAEGSLPLTPEQLTEERLYLRLRTAKGIPSDWGLSYFDPQALEELLGARMLEMTADGSLRLSEEYWLLLDEIFLRLLPRHLDSPISYVDQKQLT